MKVSELPQHHAILLVHSNRVSLAESLFDELKKESFVHRFFNQTVLDIETARAIISWAQSASFENRTAVISFHTVGHEAQNALLKMLEEPQNGVRFILVTSNKASLIDTVLSRVHHVHLEDRSATMSAHVLEFLKTKNTARMKLPFITELLTRVDEEDRKDREGVREFILTLSSVLSKQKYESRYILKTLDVASYAALPSASGKALLEYLALLLPQGKV